MDHITFREGFELLGPLLEQSSRDLAFTTNSLIDNLANDHAEALATVELIRERVLEITSGDFMPSMRSIRHALFPNALDVTQRAAVIIADQGIHSSTYSD